MGFVALLDLFGKYGVWEIGRCDDDVILKLFLLKCNEKAKGNLFLLQKTRQKPHPCSRSMSTALLWYNPDICGEAVSLPSISQTHSFEGLVYSLSWLFVVITRYVFVATQWSTMSISCLKQIYLDSHDSVPLATAAWTKDSQCNLWVLWLRHYSGDFDLKRPTHSLLDLKAQPTILAWT